MGRSSRFLCALCLMVATPALGQPGRALMPMTGARAPVMPMARPIVRPNVGMGYVRSTLGSRPVRPALGYVRPTLGSRVVRPNSGYALGYTAPTLGSRAVSRTLGYVRPTLGVRSARGPLVRSLRGRIARGRFASGGLDSAGLGLSLADDLAIPGFADGFYGEPQIIPGLGPQASCIRPQIIKIGAGVRRHAKTRVVYGPANCVP